MENKILTAEDFMIGLDGSYFQGEVFGEFAYTYEVVKEALIKFAHYHVNLALEAASVKARMKITSGWGNLKNKATAEIEYSEKPIEKENYGHGDCTYQIIEPDRSIPFEAYPLSNIQ